MSIEGGITRRSLLQRGTLLGGAAVLGGWLPFPVAAQAAAESSEPAVLSPAEWKTLEAMSARIVPSDAEPGAREAGCVNFIDKALAHEEAAALPLYQAGLAAIEAAAQAAYDRPFTALEPEPQDALLAKLEGGTVEAWPADAPPAPAFFEAVRAHTLIGFLSDPRYGGNRDFAGWRVAGYPGPRHRRGGYTPAQMAGTEKIRTVWGEER